MTSSSPAIKAIKSIVGRVHRPHWVGDGFHVYPLFNELAFTEHISPFLMFDYAPEKKFEATTKKRGVGMHPHRGFETVTLALQGEIDHRDTEGHSGTIGTGEVQWMTAGSGLFHEEFHSAKFAKEGGNMEMMQLWVNLPARLKMIKPRYQPILRDDIAKVELPDDKGVIEVIAGEYEGVKGPAVTDFEDSKGNSLGRGHIDVWFCRLVAGNTLDLPTPNGHTTLIFTRKNQLSINDQLVGENRVVVMEREGDIVTVAAPDNQDADFVVLGGEPIIDQQTGKVEPIAARGPMVMNTEEEIREAMMWAYSQHVR